MSNVTGNGVPVPKAEPFSLTPGQAGLEKDYKAYLEEHFGIAFNQLYTITNLPIGRTRFQLEHRKLYRPYLNFLADNHNASTVEHLMCRSELSVDYDGNIYDCDFNQMLDMPLEVSNADISGSELIASTGKDGSNNEKLHIDQLIGHSIDGEYIRVADHCYGCTAGQGSSCGGALD